MGFRERRISSERNTELRGALPPAHLDIQPGEEGWEGPSVEEGAGLSEGTTRLDMVKK